MTEIYRLTGIVRKRYVANARLYRGKATDRMRICLSTRIYIRVFPGRSVTFWHVLLDTGLFTTGEDPGLCKDAT